MQHDVEQIRSEVRERYMKFLSEHYQPLLESLRAQGKYEAFFKEDWELMDGLIEDRIKDQIPADQIIAYCLELQIQHSGPSQMNWIEAIMRARFPEVFAKWAQDGKLRDLILKVARKGAATFEQVRFDEPSSPFYYLDATLVEYIREVHRQAYEMDGTD